jgi:RND family efflux transporter MFP subunit
VKMVPNWATTVTMTGALLLSACLAVVTVNPADGMTDTNERLKGIVKSVGAGNEKPVFELSPMEIAKIEPTALVEILRVSGETRPVHQATLRAKSAGQIIQLDVREGQQVKAGELLLRFDTADLLSNLKQKEAEREGAMAGLLLAMQSLNRVEQLAGKSVVSQEQLEKAKSEVAATKAKLDSLSARVEIARIALRDADVVAPIDGVISKLSVNRGARVGEDTDLLTLVDHRGMEARVFVPTRDALRVGVGQAVELQIDGTERLVVGEIARIAPTADDGTRFVPVYVRLLDATPRLKGGMFVTGAILLRQAEDAVAVPVASLRQDRAGDYVLKLAEGVLVRQPVTIISRWNGEETAQISGLRRGDVIVTAPLREFEPNLSVRLTKAG